MIIENKNEIKQSINNLKERREGLRYESTDINSHNTMDSFRAW
jgi:hypothetical protein